MSSRPIREIRKDDRLIFHVDVNSAFLSWSAIKLLRENPNAKDLRTIPSIVGGEVNRRHGVVTAASVPAKRLGINSGEPVAKALQKCPWLVFTTADFEWYRECSHEFLDILNSYAPVVEQASIDEAFADMTGTAAAYEPLATEEYPFPFSIAKHIRDEVYSTLGFTVNVGISSNKLLAKMASDFSKPNKIHTLFPDEIEEKMWPLPIGNLFGCGRQTAERLQSIGIRTIGDAAVTDESLLKELLGEKGGAYIFRSANGISYSTVTSERPDAKSISNETTLPFDITGDNYGEEMPPVLKHLSEKVAGRMQRANVTAKTLTVMVKTNDFKRHSCQNRFAGGISSPKEIYTNAQRLMDGLLLGSRGLFETKKAGIRLVGVGVSSLDDGSYRQLSLFDFGKEEDGKLTKMRADIEARFGSGAIRKGIDDSI